MKRGGPTHPKTYNLAERLGVRRVHAIGILELLFHFASQYAPEGDVGRYSDKRIAAALDWGGAPGKLVAALVESGWLDPHPTARLAVHDWAEHADRTTLQRLARGGKKPVCPATEDPDLGCTKVVADKPAGVSRQISNFEKSGIQSNYEDTRKLCTQTETSGITLGSLPEPEPEPEPVPEPPPLRTSAPRAGVRPIRSPERWRADETFSQFVEKYKQTGAALIDEDFSEAYGLCWKALDWAQKRDRVKALEDHFGEYSADPRFVPKPLKFIEKEWQRPLKPAAQKPETAIDRLLKQAKRDGLRAAVIGGPQPGRATQN